MGSLHGDKKYSSPLVSTRWLGMYCPWAASHYCQWSRIIIEESVERIWFVLFWLGEPSQWGVHKERRQNCSFGLTRCEGHPHWLARQSKRHHHQMYRCEATYSSCNIHMWNMWLRNLPGLELVTSPCVSGLCRDISKLIYLSCNLLSVEPKCFHWDVAFDGFRIFSKEVALLGQGLCHKKSCNHQDQVHVWRLRTHLNLMQEKIKN